MDGYTTGYRVSKVNIDESAPPQQVQEAFNDVQKAKEDEQRFKNDANAYAERVIPEARGDAQKQIEEAGAYRDQVIARAEGEADRFTKLLTEYTQAKRVTRDRLHIDAMERVLSQSSKVLIDVEGGNNMLYLPLDRMTQSRSLEAEGLNPESVRSIVDATVRDLSERAASNRRRDTR